MSEDLDEMRLEMMLKVLEDDYIHVGDAWSRGHVVSNYQGGHRRQYTKED